MEENTFTTLLILTGAIVLGYVIIQTEPVQALKSVHSSVWYLLGLGGALLGWGISRVFKGL